MKNKFVLIAAALVILGAGFFVASKMYKTNSAEKIGFMAATQFKTFVPDHAPRKGDPDAKVFVVEYLDPECESCREFYPITKMFLEEYAGKIQLVVRYAPFHGNSEFIIKVIEAARKQGKYWEALELLFQHQPEWGSHHNPQPELVWNYLPQLGLDIEKLKSDMNDPQIMSNLEQDKKDGQALMVSGTPTFFVDGKMVEEFGPDAVKAAIDAALATP